MKWEKCALAVVINSGSLEHKAKHWLTNKEQGHILPPVAVSARPYYKNKAVFCGYFLAVKQKIPTQKLVIWHSSVSLTHSDHQRPAIKKTDNSRSALKYCRAIWKTLLLIYGLFWPINYLSKSYIKAHLSSKWIPKSITFTFI